MLTSEQRAAFASVRKVWSQERIILIGAGALRLQKRLARVTADLDIVVAVELSDYAGTFLVDAWFRPDPKQPQRWTHGNGVQLDILPAGQDLRARGHIESSEEYDTGDKLEFYRTIPSLREYIVVSHRERRVTVHMRAVDGSWSARVAVAGGRVQIASLDLELDVDHVYRTSSIR